MPIGKDLREAIDPGVRWSRVRNAGRRIQRDQVQLGFDSRQQRDESTRVLGSVVDAVEQHVLERDAASLFEREASARLQDVGQRVFPVRRNKRRPLLIGRGVERYCQVRHHWFLCQPFESGDDPDGRERDATR